MTDTGPVGVLDASALLAYLIGEPGADAVEATLGHGVVMSAVNLAEVLSWFAERGEDPVQALGTLRERDIVDGLVSILPYLQEDVVEVARLRPLTRARGLSLGDRMCLALGTKLSLPVFTADRAWEGIQGVEVKLVR